MSDLNNNNEVTCDFTCENKERLKIESFYFAKWLMFHKYKQKKRFFFIHKKNTFFIFEGKNQ